MEEAEQCDRLAIMDQGKLVASDHPTRLKGQIGGDVITLQTRQPEVVARQLRDELKLTVDVTDGIVRLKHASGHDLTPAIYRSCPDLIESISIGKPTLLDVFIQLTGRRFDAESVEPAQH
jgi:ABC-2 type transport system ATP-binding protein